MHKPVLVVTACFVDAVEARLKQDFELRRKKNGAHFTPEELLSAADGADAMLVTPADRLDAAFFTRVASSVKVIATHSAGYDHIDLTAAAARKIAIANIPALSTGAVAGLTLLLLLGASRRAYEAQQVVRSGNWNPSDLTFLLGWQLTGRILGICGMGRIGQAVAKRARGFGMKIHYHEPHRLPPEIEGDAVFHDDLYDLLRVSPLLSFNAPETKQTHHFLDAKAIACLPRGAIVVNAARGGMVVDEDLITALKNGQVAAVGLDTYEGEPKLNPGYLPLKNTFLLPHIGAATVETRTAMGMLALENIDASPGRKTRSFPGDLAQDFRVCLRPIRRSRKLRHRCSLKKYGSKRFVSRLQLQRCRPSHNPERLQPLGFDRPATAAGKPCPNTKLVSTAPLAKLTRH